MTDQKQGKPADPTPCRHGKVGWCPYHEDER